MTLNLNVLKSTHLDHYKENIAGFSVANTCSSCIHLTDKQKGNVNYSFRLNKIYLLDTKFLFSSLIFRKPQNLLFYKFFTEF